MKNNNLIIRYFEESDYNDFCLLIRDKMNGKYKAYDVQLPTDDNELKMFLCYCIIFKSVLAIEKQDDKMVIGYIAINRVDDETRNLGFTVRSDYQNKGYATKAVSKAIGYLREKLNIKK